MLELTGARYAGGLISIKRTAAKPGYRVRMKPWQRDQLRRALEQRRETLIDELKRDAARLRAEPAAARCVECQARHEKTYRR